MKLCVFGASGKCGDHFVRLAAARGHNVTAVVRAETGYKAATGVRLVRGDVLNAAFVASVLPGHDVAVSCLGMRYKHPWARRESPDDFTSRAIENIVAATQAAHVRRLTVISAAGVGDSRPALNVAMRVMLAISNVGVAYADLERAEQIVRRSSLDWQIVRPATLTAGARSGQVRRIQTYGVTDTIPREDVAEFMLDQLERGPFDERTPMIAASRASSGSARLCRAPDDMRSQQASS
jgi:putative NADH-flavin reductase